MKQKPINHWIGPTVDTGARDYRVACGVDTIELPGRPPWKVSDRRWQKIRKYAPGTFKRVAKPTTAMDEMDRMDVMDTPAEAGTQGNETQPAAPIMGKRKKGGRQ
jgi:hypothetical protein